MIVTFVTGTNMLIYGIDPGLSGAWGVIDHRGGYVSTGDMIHAGKFLDTESIWDEMMAVRNGQDCEVCLELVHSYSGQGVASTFTFGAAFGGAIALAQRFRAPWHMVHAAAWKKAMGLSKDKGESLEMARELWPAAPLKRKKDNGRAESLLLAEYWRRQLFDVK
jgi:crossover junction endodeoxyribonuclease RuvC